MRTLKLHFPDDALPTLDTFVKQTKEARVFRRAQAVRHVVKGQRLQTVSDALSFTYSALRKWVYRFASQGVQGLVDRPRSGRPPKVTCRLVKKLMRPRTRSISGARRVVLDSESGLDVFPLPLTEERAGHSPSPDDFSRDDSAPHTREAHARVRLPQTGSAATDTPPSQSAPTAPRRR